MRYVPDRNGITAFFIINYEGGGFLILSGDKRAAPVMAYSENNVFKLNYEDYSGGVKDFMILYRHYIEGIREGKIIPDNPNSIENQWQKLTDVYDTGSFRSYNDPPGGGDCPDNVTLGPLLETTWGQGCTYNTYCPVLYCGHCNHALTGCVTTAMAQVMRYYEYPNNYTWANMPDAVGSSETAELMSDIFQYVIDDYYCGASVDNNYSTNITGTFENHFGYSDATYSSYNYSTVANEIDSDRPVILLGWPVSGIGHTWVCDGYREIWVGDPPCCSEYVGLHMNWGIYGDYDGWYSYDNFNPNGTYYNYYIHMVYNILP